MEDYHGAITYTIISRDRNTNKIHRPNEYMNKPAFILGEEVARNGNIAIMG